MRISDWSSDVCSSDLTAWRMCHEIRKYMAIVDGDEPLGGFTKQVEVDETIIGGYTDEGRMSNKTVVIGLMERGGKVMTKVVPNQRSEEHTSELQSLMRISYAVFCLKNKKTHNKKIATDHQQNTTQ